MATVGITIFFALLLCGLAIRANSRFRNRDRLPMQWWLTGDVTWSALGAWRSLSFLHWLSAS